jgi:hypothetical protein
MSLCFAAFIVLLLSIWIGNESGEESLEDYCRRDD